jgi:hypothetical protein
MFLLCEISFKVNICRGNDLLSKLKSSAQLAHYLYAFVIY